MLNIYRASAGSGKTYRLTQDYIHLLFEPGKERAHRRILAVTFTNKATDEMKTRILNELFSLSQGQKSDYRKGLCDKFKLDEDAVNARARKILTSILHDFSSFSISTIDKFFQQVIRSFARDIGVHGGYNLELDTTDTLEQSVDNMFHDLSKDENKQLLNWLTQFAEDRIEQSENWNMRGSILDLGQEIFKESYQHKAEDTNRKLHDRDFLLAYRKKLRTIESDFEEKVKTAAQQGLDAMSKYGLSHTDYSYSTTKTFDKLINGKYEIGSRFMAFADDASNCYTKKAPQHIKNAIESAYAEGFRDAVVEIIRLLNEDIVMYNSASIVLKHINTLGILSDLALQIKKLTEEQNSMLISDTNMLLNKIIDNSDAPFVYEKTGIHIDNFMIDEFQDTSTLQWKNFFPLIDNSLSANKFNLVVGDVKQSIYRWRNSDWKLLDEQLMKDFRPEQIHEEELDTNWRSDKNIVEFNNLFFKQGASLLQVKLNEGVDKVLPLYPELHKLTEKISHAYKNIQQNVSKKAGLGRVDFTFIPRDENEEGWKTESLNRIPALIEDLQLRGYRPGDVAFLVRTNGEEQEVIHKLLNYKTTAEAKPGIVYDIMGNEGLVIASAASVRFILGILQLFVNPTDSVQKTIVNYEYARARKGLSEKDALNLCFDNSESSQRFSTLFSNDENNAIEALKHSSLYEMVEKLISVFDIGSWHNEAVFVQAFQDVVYKFAISRTADLYSFLKWWAKSGIKQCISTPDNPDAFRIMTIHKSKGLDFKVVIMPFCDWTFDKKSGFFKNVLWCEPKEEPFNELPLLPVEYSAKLGNSIFAENYFDELMHQYIDNLNVAYVAFTRAKHELICFLPQPKNEIESVEKIGSVSDMLSFCLKNNDLLPEASRLPGNFDAATGRYTIGEIFETTRDENKDENKTTELNEKINFYPSVSSAGRLRIRHQSLDYLLNNQRITDSRLNYGIIMHEILCRINQKSDQPKAIDALVREGRINIEESKLVQAELDKFWNLPETSDWFAGDTQMLNETTILTPTGELYRPDKVILKDKNAIVVDYKFGHEELDKYKNQVKQYMNLIEQMNYRSTGFVCYISLGKVIQVD